MHYYLGSMDRQKVKTRMPVDLNMYIAMYADAEAGEGGEKLWRRGKQ